MDIDVAYLANYVELILPDAWIRCAPTAMEQYRSDWLEGFDWERTLEYYGFEAEYRVRFRRELVLLRGDETLRQVCWLLHYFMFYSTLEDFRSVWKWKSSSSVNSIGGHGTPVTCVVALLAGQPMHEQMMIECRYDAEQIEQSKRGVRDVWVGEHTGRGIDGVRFGLMLWGAYYIKGSLVQIGCLQYEYGLMDLSPLAGLIPSEADVVSVHIPGGRGLDPETVNASFRAAHEKLESYFHNLRRDKLVFYTHTWLLSPQLREFLPEKSNIIHFQNLFTIISREERASSFLNWVFNENRAPGSFDYRELREDNLMQREIKRRLIAGVPLEVAGGYFRLRP